MQNTSTCFNVTDELILNLSERENHYGFNMSELFEVGTRLNPKRSFLFISKLLGKHLEVEPYIPKLAGYMLANKYNEIANLNGWDLTNEDILKAYHNDASSINKVFSSKLDTGTKPLVIGFAETATGLGHAVFSSLFNATYVHTTREEIAELNSLFDFEEEHSHATGHLCYLSNEILDSTDEIYLVDDEITTGKTALNLIKSLNSVYPGKKFKVFTLLDWRNDNHIQTFEDFKKETHIQVEVVSIFSGTIDILNEKLLTDNITETVFDNKNASYKNIIITGLEKEIEGSDHKYIAETGRFGLTSNQNDLNEEKMANIGATLQTFRKFKNSLVVGSGELIYLPSLLAMNMGENVKFKSFTRSPILPLERSNYPIHSRISFYDKNNNLNHLYNMDNVDEVFIVLEGYQGQVEFKEKMASLLTEKGIKNVVFVDL